MPIPNGRGYSWTPPAGVMPALLCAAEIMHPRTQPSGRIMYDSWVLDYNFTAGELVRLAAPTAPWVERPARVAHLYPPRLPFWEASGNRRPLVVQCAYLLFADAGQLSLERLVTAPAGHARFLDEDGTLGALLSEMVRIGEDEGDAGYWRAHARFYDCIALLQRAHPLGDGLYRLQAGGASAQSAFVRQVRAYFHTHLAAPITLAVLARELEMSPSAFSHRYRAEVGEPPMATLKRERINLAKVLLAKGYHLKEIAVHVGFYDEFHLSKAFKQLEGLSPRDFRNSNRERE